MTAKLARGTALKAAAMLIALLSLSLVFECLVDLEPIGHVAAAPGSFGSPVLVNDKTVGEQAMPIIVSVPARGLFLVWQDSRSGHALYSSLSLNNGTTFTSNMRADDPIFNTSFPKEAAVAVSGNGTTLVTWQDNRRSTFDYDIFFAKLYRNGARFTTNTKVDDSNYTRPSWQEDPSIAITLSGRVYIAWTDGRTGQPRLRGAYSTDMGETFSASREIVPGGKSAQNQVHLVANGNRIFAAFIDNVSGTNHPYICNSVDGGKTFSAPTRLDATGDSGKSQIGISIAPLPNGGVVATWADGRNGDSDIYAVLVNPDGKVGSPNIRVDNDSGLTYAWQEHAYVTTDQLGNVYVVWQDERATGTPAIRFAFMKAGKTQFNSSTEVSPPSGGGGTQNIQYWPSVAAQGPGQVFVAWQDDRAGTDDVYVSRGYFPNMYNLALGKGWNFISMFLSGGGYKASTLGLASGDVVVGWNSSRGAYDQQFIVGVSPPVADFAISSSTGYWVYAGAALTISINGTLPTSRHTKTVTVPTGGYWVSVGFESLNSTRKASDIPSMFSVLQGVTTVVSYNPTTGKYSNYIVGIPSTDFKIVPGQGYWCWITTSGVLTYDP